MTMNALARIFIILGLIFLVMGGLVYLLGRLNLPLGRLPGDIRIERENFTCLIPVTTMILLSIGLSLLLNVLVRLFGRK